MYQPRHYRKLMGNDRWASFGSCWYETDLWVAIDTNHYREEAKQFTLNRIKYYRDILEQHISLYPFFRDSLVPLKTPQRSHPLVIAMYKAANMAGTGPMSAVAGAIAECICMDLLEEFNADEVVIENGGDIYMKLTAPVTLSVFAGTSVLSDKIALKPVPSDTPLAVCCSSGTVGHAFSFGKTDACMIACRGGALADAFATAFGNEVKRKEELDQVTNKALKVPEILSVVIIKDDHVAMGGSIEFAFQPKGS